MSFVRGFRHSQSAGAHCTRPTLLAPLSPCQLFLRELRVNDDDVPLALRQEHRYACVEAEGETAWVDLDCRKARWIC